MVEIIVTELPEQPTACIREIVAVHAMPQFFERTFHAVLAVLQEQGLAPAGPPYAIYYRMPTDTVDVAAGFPVTGPVEPSGEVWPGTLPGGRTYEAVHVGPYDAMQPVYHAILQRMTADDEVPADVMWEQYLSDPAEEPDPARWRTRVGWPVRR